MKDSIILAHLRTNARKSLTTLAAETGIPATTIYSRVNKHEKGLIKKYTAILDFEKLGMHGRMCIAVKLDDAKKRETLMNFLKTHNRVNSLYKTNMDYNYLIEAVFKNANEADAFVNLLEEHFGVTQKQVFNIIEELKKEDFLTKPEHYEI